MRGEGKATPMHDAHISLDPTALLEPLAAKRLQLVMAATGGGSQAICALASTPGASEVLVEGLVPYSRHAIDRLLGGPQEQYCSPKAARRLAVAAWQRAVDCGVAPEQAVGAAVTASLATNRPKRGSHRVHVAVQTLASTGTSSLQLSKGARNRIEEEDLASRLLCDAIATSCNRDFVDARPFEAMLPAAVGSATLPHQTLPLRSGEHVENNVFVAPDAWHGLLAGRTPAVLAGEPGEPRRAGANEHGEQPRSGMLVFPGSFDPLHDGHCQMASVAEEVAERPVAYEVSVTNVEKPALDYMELGRRVAAFDTQRAVWLTRAATFVEKTEIFPKATFVMGADTFVRLFDPTFYGGSADAARTAVRKIGDRVEGMIVFGREKDGVFVEPSSLKIPKALREKCYFVSSREFRMDISSTAIRRTRARKEEAACEMG
jgi:nicotinic acid mononucleotide adenylyltransferase/nicotinamide mononucleotide (NMN) deamidase PncC